MGVGVGVFPNWRYPRVIWAGLSGDVDETIELHNKLENAFVAYKIKRDERAFRLHLTLGRAKSPLKNPSALVGLVEKLGGKEFGDIHIDQLILYRSQLTREGPIYTALKKFPLKGQKR
jgi:2'-5' RNA ligase